MKSNLLFINTGWEKDVKLLASNIEEATKGGNTSIFVDFMTPK